MSFFSKIKKSAKIVGNKLKETKDISKIKLKIKKYNKKIKKLKIDLGAKVVNKNQDRLSEDILKLKQEAEKIKNRINELEIKKIKRKQSNNSSSSNIQDDIMNSLKNKIKKEKNIQLNINTKLRDKKNEKENLLSNIGTKILYNYSQANWLPAGSRSIIQEISQLEQNISELKKYSEDLQQEHLQQREGIKNELSEEVKKSKKTRKNKSKSKKSRMSLENILQVLGKTPIITAISDVLSGVSGTSEKIEKVKNDPNDTRSWLFLGQAMKTKNILRGRYRAIRAPFNPVSTALNTAASSSIKKFMGDRITPDKCFKKAISVGKENIKNNQASETFAIVGLSYYQLGTSKKVNYKTRQKLLSLAASYLKYAIKNETNNRLKAEYIYHLAEIYSVKDQDKLFLKWMNRSRKLGFKPSLKSLKLYFKSKNRLDEVKGMIKIPPGSNKYDKFALYYCPDIEERITKGVKSLIKKQSNKITNSGEIILDNIIYKIL